MCRWRAMVVRRRPTEADMTVVAAGNERRLNSFIIAMIVENF